MISRLSPSRNQPHQHQISMRHTLTILCSLALLFGCTSTPKCAKTDTSQLQLRHQQCVDFLNGEKKQWEVKFGNPLFMGDGGRADRIKEKEEIEGELLHRYQAGDQRAYLPMFGMR
jgi:hypothetical protein